MKTTIKDIAQKANVSVGTVSKILNKKDGHISDETRQKVMATAKELNYTPNTLARSLVTRQTKTIGLILPDISNPFFPELARGAEDKASEAGYSIMYCNTDDDMKKEDKYIQMLTEKMVDGIIITQSTARKMTSEKLQSVTTPIVLIDRDVEGEGIRGKVLVDNLMGAYEAMKHLILKGHKKIVFVAGPLTSNTTKARLEGYKKALKEFKIPFNQNYILEGQYKSEWGFNAVKQLFEKDYDFDAVFCGNDLIAISVVRALKDAGKLIPQNIAVIGYDDIPMASLIEPPLTTVRQPIYEMGYHAAEMLVDIIENPNEDIEERSVLLDTQLIIRKTT
ncbi:LacI family DNA-binding transcriptional regulator [Cellulosilyticum sp. I15G10I2]|uniref:LacI family DNA-binding transcriptional regulator n=1 Tax=Cellulosilyticum sp. I15G10I2 TaxID=1892843 RepID=UPI00085CC032|nr:LacI family DNA-binding transcriptional regulator [Cellulosilyticum sp. I15G10I2]